MPELTLIPPMEIIYWDRFLAVPPLSSIVIATELGPYLATLSSYRLDRHPLENATVYVTLGVLDPPIVAFTRIYRFTVPVTVIRSAPTVPLVVNVPNVVNVVSSELC